MTRSKRKKNSYIPGIFSLTVLPIVFVYFASKEIKARTLHVISIFFADTNFAKQHPEFYLKFHGYFPPRREYFHINFTGNFQYDKIKLAFAQLRIREILLHNNSANGIHFKFDNNSHFGTFVNVLDILRFEGANTYMSIGDNLWFYYFPRDTIRKQSFYTCLMREDFISKTNKSWWRTVNDWMNKIWESSWQIILSFSIFLLSIFILGRKAGSS